MANIHNIRVKAVVHQFPKCEKKPAQSIESRPWKQSREYGGATLQNRQADRHLQKTSAEYTVGWISAICTEYTAAQASLDEEHERPSHVAPADQNDYVFGRIGNHNVVIACLPDGDYGVESAAIVARDMMHSFPNIKIGLMVGVGGGAPSEKHDIRLGDIVVGVPRDGQSGVLQYGFGKMIQGQPFQATRLLNQSPRILRAAVNGVESQYRLKGHRQLREIIGGILKRNPTLQQDFGRPNLSSDRLYRSEIVHPEDGISDCSVSCGDDPSKLVVRPRRIIDEGSPAVHYGLIASSNTLMKDAMMRDEYALKKNVMCFEMEAAGLMNQFPCLVIRGISDYSDTHKNKQWQGYAAMAAAAYAKDLLYRIALDNSTSISQRVAGEGKTQVSSDSQKQALLNSLKFDHYNKHYDSIKAVHAGTCKWLQENAGYISWLDPDKINDHRGFLWINGGAGTGKSRIMKYALATARETMGERILLSFFFNARGSDLEKSTLGMYRSLLLQLLQQLPALQDSLDLSKFTAHHGEEYQWHIEPLKSLFRQAIENIQTSKVICFIDALSECDEDQARDMISFFEYLADLATSKGISYLVCFSRRYYPLTSNKRGINLMLESRMRAQDITEYVRSELRIGQSDIANRIRADLPRRSWGLFVWVKSVVSILNKEYEMGRIYNLQTRYHEIPRDLHELFKDILARYCDQKSIETLRCFQWLSFSRELLRPEQLYHAVLSDVSARVAPSQISMLDMMRFITNSSMGLAGPIVQCGKVYFIHDLVRDFLLKEDGLRQIWPDLGDNIHGRSHEQLKQCCLKCIEMGAIHCFQLIRKNPNEKVASIHSSVSDNFPFLGYAVSNVLYHANAAQKYGISQAEFVKEFKLFPWIVLRRIFEVWEHSPQTRLLYALAELNMSHLIGCHPSKLAFSEVGDEFFGTPLFAALANGSNEAIVEFLKAQAEITPEFHNLYEEYCRKSLDLSHFRPGFIFSPSKNILSHFTHPDEGNKILQVAFLLNMRHAHLHLDWKDECSQAPLLYVYGKGNKALLGVLISKYVNDVNEIDHFSSALLQTAVRKGYKDLVELLLQKGSKIDETDNQGQTALYCAVQGEDKDMVQLLIKSGANIEAYDWNDGNTPLGLAAAKGYMDIVILLIKSDAKIEVRNGLDHTPLMLAVINGHKDVAIQLIKEGAKTEARDRFDHTPLMLAVTEGRKDMAILLLENGCDIEAMDDDGMTPLLLAMENHHTDVVVQLLKRGCDFEARDVDGMTPLMCAVRLGSKDAVSLLLGKGASMEAMDKSGKTLLTWAVIGGHEEFVTRLLDKGSDIEAMDKDGQTPLMWAIRKRNPGLVRLLLSRGAKVTTGKVANVRPRQFEFPQQLREKIMANSELTLLGFAQQFEEVEIIELLSQETTN